MCPTCRCISATHPSSDRLCNLDSYHEGLLAAPRTTPITPHNTTCNPRLHLTNPVNDRLGSETSRRWPLFFFLQLICWLIDGTSEHRNCWFFLFTYYSIRQCSILFLLYSDFDSHWVLQTVFFIVNALPSSNNEQTGLTDD